MSHPCDNLTGIVKLIPFAGLLCLAALVTTAQDTADAVKPDQAARDRMKQVETCLLPPVLVKGEARPCSTLQAQMQKLNVTALSIAVIHNGAVDWVAAYGATPDTIFQAGSISKPLAAIGALHLVQEGKLPLDSNIDPLLTSWKIPASTAAPNAVVTLRELLTHTAGFTVHGFPGYAKGEPVPTLVQVLNGEKPANTPAIRLETVPGSQWKYSGGGLTVMQQLVVDVTKQPFPTFLHDTVLAPIGMTHSTYQQPLPADLLSKAALPYRADGSPVAGGPHTYPEMAAAGLWTTPFDLVRYILEVQRSLRGRANHVLSEEMTKKMLEPGKGDWGLGVQIGGSPGNRYFTHGGVNEGYQSIFVGYEHTGEGAAVMTNSDSGMEVAEQVVAAIATAYGWPDFQPAERTQIKLDHAALEKYAGVYEIQPGVDVTFTLEGDQLMTQLTGQPKIPVYPEGKDKFYVTVVDAEVEFTPDATGKITSLVIHQGGHDAKAVKK